MDERDQHWNDIIAIAKESRLNNQPAVTELDKQAKAQLDANVHAHIQQQFKVITLDHAVHEQTSNEDCSSTRTQQSKSSLISRLKDQLRHVGRTPALALVAVCAISLGLFTSLRDSAEPFTDAPDSLFNAGLDTQLTLTNSGQRALSANTSQRRHAFVSGAIRADLDVAQDSNNNTSNIINNYPGFFGENDNATNKDKLAIFTKQTNMLLANSDLKRWLHEGYLIELTRLAALNALNTTDTKPLNDIIQHLAQLTTLKNSISSSDGLDPNYMSDRDQLTTSTISTEFMPDDIQQIVDLTKNLQVLAQ